MKKTEPKKNLIAELAKRKAEAQAKGGNAGILGKDLSNRFNKGGDRHESYSWRGGRNGSGKP